jgi:hypothetical protein
MTGIYDWNPIPSELDVRCPRCQRRAQFRSAEVWRVELKAYVEYFRSCTYFEYRQFEGPVGGTWHGAVHYPGLHGDPSTELENLPSGYETGNLNVSKNLWRVKSKDIGSIRCGNCLLKKKHNLNWPSDAYYSLSYRHKILWAFDRASASELYDFIMSKTRKLSKYRFSSFLLHVPAVFKTQKAREHVGNQLFRLLASDSKVRPNYSFQGTSKKLRLSSALELKRYTFKTENENGI